MRSAGDARFVYPRLPFAAASELFAERRGQTLEELRRDASPEQLKADYYATGERVPRSHLQILSESVRRLADELGFPGNCIGPAQREFDQSMPGLLHRKMRIVPADAAKEGVWSFLTLVVLPDVAFWRFPNPPEARLIGRPRNVFRRYWWRAHVLGAGEGGLAPSLGEDQHVQIEERRASIGGNPPLARTLAREVLEYSHGTPNVSREALMRDAAKRLVRLTPFTCFEALSQQELTAQVGELVREAAAALRL